MKRWWLAALALPLIAAAPVSGRRGQLTLVIPSDTITQPFGLGAEPRLQPAPTPNRDLSGPAVPRSSNEPTLAPTLFSSHERYRGDGFSRGSSAQSEQERNLKPPVGFSLHMPFAPQ